MGGYYLFSQSLGDYVILPAITIGFLSMAVLNLNNMRDRIPDMAAGKNTLAVKLGPKNVKVYHSFLILGALGAAIAYITLTAIDLLSYLPLIAFIPLMLNLVKVIKTEDAAKLDPELKKVALSTFLFSLLLFGIQLF